MDDEDPDRHSVPSSADVIADPDERARREARNGLRQFDAVTEIVDSWIAKSDRKFKLRPSTILHLHRVALEGISAHAGNYRPAGVEIRGSEHRPVGAHLVPELVEDLCDYVNENWSAKSPIHIAAYAMWRLNWIHPFVDGNGRTARALSYLVLCLRLGYRLPGTKTIPDQIATNKTPYYTGLESADASEKAGLLDLSKLEDLLGNMLAAQLAHVHEQATSSSA
jgi:Fic family protein